MHAHTLTHTHTEVVVECYYKDVTPICQLILHFYFDEKIAAEGKISSSENSVEKKKIPKTLSCITGYFWWLGELFGNKEAFHKASKIQKI